jgi:ferric-dicitrate binding protein FerR (iron transport regulator)
MSLFKKNEDLLDDAVAQVANEPIDERQVESAAARVWARLAQEGAAGAPAAAAEPVPAPVAGSLHGCEDFRSLIPAYLRGELPPARALLVEDHTRNCVPCRRALREAKEGRPQSRPAAAAARRHNQTAWMAVAAVLALALGAGLIVLLQEMLAGGSQMARIESVEGTLYRVAGDSSQAVGAGEWLDEGEVIRTAKGSTALVRMEDGSLVEMSERAGLSFDAGRKGNTIELERGRVIVRAAKQRERHLFVETRDALVSVTGTIFSVNNGTKGTRVSVIEGEVRVKQARRDTILHPGHQVATHPSVQPVPVKQEIAWSRNAAEYQQLLAELTALGQEIDARVARPGLRYSTRLLDLTPAGTMIYIALPNLASSLSETHQILDQRIEESPTLAKWWQDTLGSTGNEEKFRDLIRKIGDLGANLGPEAVVAVGGEGEADEPVLLAEVTNPAAFRATLEREIAELNAREGKDGLQIVDDPATAADTEGLLLWIGDGLFVASPDAARLQQVAALAAGGANPFTGTTFHRRIAQDYQDGAGWLFAADLNTLITKEQAEEPEEERQTTERLGILDMEHFIVNRREIDGRAETRAALTFDQARRGVAAWLAAPAPMGTLSFFSPDANLVGAFVVKNPVSIVDELLAINPEFAAEMEKIRAEHGFDLRNDFAAAFGGEVAMAVDGPVLPEPSWKLVAEVYDPARLQQTFERVVAHINDELREHGQGHQVQLVEEESGGRTYYSIRSTDPKFEFYWVYEDGYLVTGPSRALLERAIQSRESGVTIASTAKFRDLLGPDGQVNVSALVYQNLAPLAESASKFIPGGRGEGRGARGPEAIKDFLLGQGPTLYYAYAETDRIVFAGSNQNPLGLNLGTLAGFGSLVGAMGEGRAEAYEELEAR